MSYSAITDPCLSEEVVNSVDKVINFYKKQVSASVWEYFWVNQESILFFFRRSRFPCIQSGARENIILRKLAKGRKLYCVSIIIKIL